MANEVCIRKYEITAINNCHPSEKKLYSTLSIRIIRRNTHAPITIFTYVTLSFARFNGM